MAAVLPRDILFRAGGATLLRYGVPGLRKATRGWELGKEIFTRASTGVGVDRLGVGRVFAADQLRTEWVDLDADGVRESLGFRLEGARTQLVTDPENFGAWTVNEGTPGRTSGQSDPFGGIAAYLYEDNDAAGFERIFQTVAFTGDGTKAISVFMRQGTSDDGGFGLYDATAVAWRHQVKVTWAAGVPSLSTVLGSGTRFPVEAWGGGWYRLSISVPSVVAANTNAFWVMATQENASDTGTVYIFGANAWNAVFPSTYQGPSGGATVRAADSLTFPIPWGPQDLTVYAKLARPAWADASGSLGIVPRIMEIGQAPGTTSSGRLYIVTQDASRTWECGIDGSPTDRFATVAVPAGAMLQLAAQFRALTTGGFVRVDVGSGFGTESLAASAFTSWVDQFVRVGLNVGADGLDGVLIDLIVAKGLRTLAEMQAVP